MLKWVRQTSSTQDELHVFKSYNVQILRRFRIFLEKTSILPAVAFRGSRRFTLFVVEKTANQQGSAEYEMNAYRFEQDEPVYYLKTTIEPENGLICCTHVERFL